MLPESLRQFEEITSPNQSHVMAFKTKLDAFLATIPDQPATPQRQRAAETNSLVHQIRPIHQGWTPPEDIGGDERQEQEQELRRRCQTLLPTQAGPRAH